jgi:hypothetical protein
MRLWARYVAWFDRHFRATEPSELPALDEEGLFRWREKMRMLILIAAVPGGFVFAVLERPVGAGVAAFAAMAVLGTVGWVLGRRNHLLPKIERRHTPKTRYGSRSS